MATEEVYRQVIEGMRNTNRVSDTPLVYGDNNEIMEVEAKTSGVAHQAG